MNGPEQIYIAATLLGALALWLLLPKGGVRGRMLGAVVAAVSLGLFVSRMPRLPGLVADSVFLILAGVTVIASVGTISTRKPVYAAIWFGLSLLGTAGLFLFQGAQFLAVATIVVYAGAILVTFLFVLMLSQPRGRAPYDRVSWEAGLSAATGAVIVGILTMTVTSVLSAPGPVTDAAQHILPADRQQKILSGEHVVRLGNELFGRHLIAVEVAGVLLLAALIGAAVIVAQAKRPAPAARAKAPVAAPSADGKGDGHA